MATLKYFFLCKFTVKDKSVAMLIHTSNGSWLKAFAIFLPTPEDLCRPVVV